MKELRGRMSIVYQNWCKSGNQDSESPWPDQWCQFATTFNNDPLTYSCLVITKEQLDQMGRALPQIHQMDTGILGESSRAAPRGTKRQMEDTDEIQPTARRSNGSSSSASPAGPQFVRALQQGVQAQAEHAERAHAMDKKMKAIEMLLAHGSEEDKENCRRQLRAMAELNSAMSVVSL